MISHVVTIEEGMKEKKRIKTEIGVWSVVKANVGDIEENKSEGRRSRTRKEVVGCVQDVVRENGFLFQFEDGKNDDINYCLLVFLCSKG